MKKTILILLAAFALCMAAEGQIQPDSVKGDTVFVHTIQLDDGRVAIEREVYESALDSLERMNEFLKWFLISIAALATALLSLMQWWQNRTKREYIRQMKSWDKSYKEFKKKKTELAELEEKLTNKCEEAEQTISNIDVKTKELVDNGVNTLSGKLGPKIKEAMEQAVKAVSMSRAFKEFEDADDKANKKDFRSAVESYDKGVEYFKPYIEEEKELISAAFIDRSIAKRNLEDYNGAIADCDEIIKLYGEDNPEAAGGFNSRGVVYLEKGDYELAEDDFNKALSLDPKHAYAHGSLAILALYKNQITDSIKLFREAISLDENIKQAILKADNLLNWLNDPNNSEQADDVRAKINEIIYPKELPE